MTVDSRGKDRSIQQRKIVDQRDLGSGKCTYQGRLIGARRLSQTQQVGVLDHRTRHFRDSAPVVLARCEAALIQEILAEQVLGNRAAFECGENSRDADVRSVAGCPSQDPAYLDGLGGRR